MSQPLVAGCRSRASQTTSFLFGRHDMVFRASRELRRVLVAVVAPSESNDLEDIGCVRIAAAIRCP